MFCQTPVFGHELRVVFTNKTRRQRKRRTHIFLWKTGQYKSKIWHILHLTQILKLHAEICLSKVLNYLYSIFLETFQTILSLLIKLHVFNKNHFVSILFYIKRSNCILVSKNFEKNFLMFFVPILKFHIFLIMQKYPQMTDCTWVSECLLYFILSRTMFIQYLIVARTVLSPTQPIPW